MATPREQKVKAALELTTLEERIQIVIDKHPYYLRPVGALAALDLKAQAAKFARLSALFAKRAPAKKHVAERTRLLDELCTLVLEAPAAVHARLDDLQRIQIVTIFSELLKRPPTSSRAARFTAPVARKPRNR